MSVPALAPRIVWAWPLCCSREAGKLPLPAQRCLWTLDGGSAPGRAGLPGHEYREEGWLGCGCRWRVARLWVKSEGGQPWAQRKGCQAVGAEGRWSGHGCRTGGVRWWVQIDLTRAPKCLADEAVA